MATHSNILAWEIPWKFQSPQKFVVGYSPWGWKRVKHNWTHTHTHTQYNITQQNTSISYNVLKLKSRKKSIDLYTHMPFSIAIVPTLNNHLYRLSLIKIII